MGQTFQYPNLLSGTRSGLGWARSKGTGGYNPDTGITLLNTQPSENFVFSPPVILHKGVDYTLHCFAASTANMSSTQLFVLDVDGSSDSYQWIGAYAALKTPGPGGAWLNATFRLDAQARDGVPFHLRFDNNGTTNSSTSLIWFRDIMLVEGTTPAAWAPAEGEELAGGGALMSANLWDVSAANFKPDADGVYNVGKTTGELNCSIAGASALTKNQTMHLGFSAKWHGAAATTGAAWASVKYADAAGNVNNTEVRIDGITTEWKRFSLSAVVPSGMRLADFHLSGKNLDAAYDATSFVLSYGSPVTLASSAHTPYTTQDHVSSVYATKASLKVTSDAVTAEVSARAQTDQMVSDLSSRLTQTAGGLSASISKLSETDEKVNAWFDFEADSSGNPQLKMGSSTSPVVGTYTNSGLAYRSRDGATIMELDASRSATISDHMEAQDVTIGKWKWVQTQDGTHMTLVWAG